MFLLAESVDLLKTLIRSYQLYTTTVREMSKSLIDESIGLLKVLIENKMVATGELPGVLESIHSSLMVMNRKEPTEPGILRKPAVEDTPGSDAMVSSDPGVVGTSENILPELPAPPANTQQSAMLELSDSPASTGDTSLSIGPDDTPNDDVIKCLICGYTGQRLIIHLKGVHKISEAAYRHQFNIPGSASLIAPSLSRQIGEKTRARHAAARLAKEVKAKPMEEREVAKAIEAAGVVETAEVTEATSAESSEVPSAELDYVDLVEELRAWRSKKELTQASVANMLGIKPPLMSSIMRLKIMPSPEIAVRIRELLHSKTQSEKPLDDAMQTAELDDEMRAALVKELDDALQATSEEGVDEVALVAELRTWQARRNLSQASVAAKLRISRTLMSGIMQQKVKISPEVAAKIKELIRG